MADHVVFAFFIADELEAIEIPLLLHEIEHNEQRKMVPKIDNFVEDVVPLYSPSEFRGHFRLTKEQVELLNNCSQAGQHLFFQRTFCASP
ncbi:hypothetical protein F2P79_008478 [Pimephales promelas]|nr:hypothetical protein F2P79_008478 [Pimephales promelas]